MSPEFRILFSTYLHYFRPFTTLSHIYLSLKSSCVLSLQALLKMDCQGLVARLVMDFVLLTTAVEVAGRWRELAERLTKVSRQQMDAYEAPHRDKNGVVDSEVHLSYRFDFSMGMLCLFRFIME